MGSSAADITSASTGASSVSVVETQAQAVVGRAEGKDGGVDDDDDDNDDMEDGGEKGTEDDPACRIVVVSASLEVGLSFVERGCLFLLVHCCT